MAAEQNNKYKQFQDHQGFITAEFGYIANTAFQAHEDRARVSEFFLISFGTFLAALLSAKFSGLEQNLIFTIFSILLVMIALLGVATLAELTRLRLAWLESVTAMNGMKDEMLEFAPDLENFFRWKTDSIPPAYKPWSVGFIKALEVSVLSGLCLATAANFTRFILGGQEVSWILGALVLVASSFLLMMLFYRQPLHKKDQAQPGEAKA